MIGWIIDWVPLWLWVVGGGVLAIATAPLWMPIARGLWAILPTPAKVLLAGIVAALGAYIAGRNRGRRNAQEEQRRKDAAAERTRVETDREVGNLSDDELDKRLKRWERKGE